MPVYVYSGAAGANDGTSWTDAYTSIASAATAAAGSEVWVASDHDQSTGAAGLTLNFSNGTIDSPVKILSVARADDSLTIGAVVRSNTGNNNYDLTLQGHTYWYGIEFQFASDILFNQTTDCRMVFESCVFEYNGDRAAGNNRFAVGGDSVNTYIFRFINCTIDYSVKTSNAVDPIAIGRNTQAYFNNLTIVPASSSMPAMLTKVNNTALKRCIVENSDISAFSAFVDTANYGEGYAIARRCKIGASQTAITGTKAFELQEVVFESCDDGTLTVPPLGLHTIELHHGTISSTLSRYRTGGANDGEQANAYAWEMTTNASAAELYITLESPPITRWVDAGSQTLTVYVASGVTLQDDEFWIDVSSPDEGGTPTAQGTANTTRPNPLDTPANLTTDGTSTWNGTGVGTAQKIDVAINPAIAGPVTVRCYLAKPSTTVYVDPRLEVA